MLFATSFIAFILMVIAWMMYTHHQVTIKLVEKHQEWDARKRDYMLSQVHRRTRVTYIIVMIAVAFLLSPAIPQNLLFVLYWGVVCLLLMAIVILAGVDIYATKTYILSLRDQRIATRRALEEEVKRMREQNNPSETPAED